LTGVTEKASSIWLELLRESLSRWDTKFGGVEIGTETMTSAMRKDLSTYRILNL